MIEALAAERGATLGVSLGLSAAERVAIAEAHQGQIEWLPLLRGAAVIIVPCDLVVLGWPNHLGRLEAAPDPVLHLWDRSLAPPPPGRHVASGVAASDVAVRTETARKLAKRLRQVRGVAIPWMPHTPVVIALVPDPSGDVLEPLRIDEPGLPGGVRIELPPGFSDRDAAAYAAVLAAAMGG